MIGFLRGKVHSFGTDYVLLDVNNIGYRISFFHPGSLKLNEEVLIYTYQNISEYEQSLYGFETLDEYDLFVKLISVKGIGPKVASNILAVSPSNELIQAIETDDIEYIKHLPGIGSKTASQIILDLRGKLVNSSNNDIKEDELKKISGALKQLGYKDKEIKPVVKELSKENLSDSEYLKKALQLIKKQ